MPRPEPSPASPLRLPLLSLPALWRPSQAYPPKLRSSGLGCGMMFGKAGAASAPPLSALLPHAAALQLVGLLSLGAAAVTLTLPGVEAEGEEPS